jgi:hypothetical protein
VLLEEHYREPIPNFQAIIAPATGDWFYIIGMVKRAQSAACGEYVVAGSGADIFARMATEMRPSEGIIPPELEALRIANELMAQEFITGAPVRASFGGAYEIFYASEDGFQRVDDVMHIFRFVNALPSRKVEIYQGPHVTRQWYDGSQLCIGSLSILDAVQQQRDQLSDADAAALPSAGLPAAAAVLWRKRYADGRRHHALLRSRLQRQLHQLQRLCDVPMMCWADKIALWLGAILAVALWLLHSIGTPAEDTPVVTSFQLLSVFAEAWWLVASKTILPLWIVLRVFDALAGGPARRRGRVTATILHR